MTDKERIERLEKLVESLSLTIKLLIERVKRMSEENVRLIGKPIIPKPIITAKSIPFPPKGTPPIPMVEG